MYAADSLSTRANLGATEATTVSYPEPIPILKGEDAREFLKRLEAFKLTKAQKELYRGCRELYRKMAPR